jgi:adenylosuccinate synthase
MGVVIAVSGPIAVGKSAVIGELAQRFKILRISTRELIQCRRQVPSEREPLQVAGEALDHETDGKWVAEDVAARTRGLDNDVLIIVDSVRISKQVEHLRNRFRDQIQHVHLTASEEVLTRRFMDRKEKGDPAVSEFASYAEARANATEAEVEQLGGIADLRIDTDHHDPSSVATLVAEKLGLLPNTRRL